MNCSRRVLYTPVVRRESSRCRTILGSIHTSACFDLDEHRTSVWSCITTAEARSDCSAASSRDRHLGHSPLQARIGRGKRRSHAPRYGLIEPNTGNGPNSTASQPPRTKEPEAQEGTAKENAETSRTATSTEQVKNYSQQDVSGDVQNTPVLAHEGDPNFSWTDVVGKNTKKKRARAERLQGNDPSTSNRQIENNKMATGKGDGGKDGGPPAIPTSTYRNGGHRKSKPRKELLPPLPLDHYKVLIRPQEGLTVSNWYALEISKAVTTAAKLSPEELAKSRVRIRKEQNIIVLSTPDIEPASRMAKAKTITLKDRQYEIAANKAAPDNSCKGVIFGIGEKYAPEYLSKTSEQPAQRKDSVKCTFQRLQIPRLVLLGNAEYRCRPYLPKEQVCDACLGHGHRKDVCPHPEKGRCATCGSRFSPHCIHCEGNHPSNDPQCPARRKAPHNKAWIKKQQTQKRNLQQAEISNTQNIRPDTASQRRELLPPTRNSQAHWPALEAGGFETPNPYAPISSEDPGLGKSPKSKTSNSRSSCPNYCRLAAVNTQVSWDERPPNPPTPAPRNSFSSTFQIPIAPVVLGDSVTPRPPPAKRAALDSTTEKDDLENRLEKCMHQILDHNRKEMQCRLEAFEKHIEAKFQRQIEALSAQLNSMIRNEIQALGHRLQSRFGGPCPNVCEGPQCPYPPPGPGGYAGPRPEPIADRPPVDPRLKPNSESPLPPPDHNIINQQHFQQDPAPQPTQILNLQHGQGSPQGYRRKREALTQFLTTQEQQPDAIALQEAGCVPSLSGYIAFCQETTSQEEKPRKRGHCSLFLLNVYSSPSKSNHTLNHLFRDALRIACPKDNNLLIVGDFNATHTTLGYAKASAKGRKLMDAIDVYRARSTKSKARQTSTPREWDSFRQLRSVASKGNRIRGDERALERWVQQIQEDVERATKTILTTDKAPVVDPHLLHLWEARRSLTKRPEYPSYPHNEGDSPQTLDADITEQEDVLLQLKKDILDYPGTAQTRAVLALDFKGGLRQRLARARCGRRTYEYVSSFLKDRIATLGIGDQRSGLILLTGRGTPQGSVLSPTLFNIAMAGLPSILNNIPRIRHSLYADDITVWVESGSDGEIQDALQTAADATQEYARAARLSCAADKSELLLIRGMAKIKINEEITVSIDGKPIPSAKRLRILGLQLQTGAKASFTVQMLRKQCQQIAHLIRRVTSKRRGLKEGDTIRIVQALLVSRIVYHAPFQNFRRKEIDALNATLRMAVKTAIGLPQNTSTERLLQLGLHNTIEELTEAQALLRRLGYRTPASSVDEGGQKPAPPAIAARVRVMPIPKTMHPQVNAGKDPDVLYTDAASYSSPSGGKCIAVCDSDGRNGTSGSLKGSPSCAVAEEAAIALAISTTQYRAEFDCNTTVAIITDSQAACRAWAGNLLSTWSNQILSNLDHTRLPLVRIVWTPGHVSLPGNGSVYALARGLTIRALHREGMTVGDTTSREDEQEREPQTPHLETFNHVTEYYRSQRKKYPRMEKTPDSLFP
ncbi:hypothetical protein HPB47_007501 [Ixodes persulcatus]|uniref:Uncharacterized protein n=1 Tax=Ixodes persulcatus TaxID=34615 RepID=A0AC60P788_IXOPE|nr:hypothetical protein HPB47_007501 [Ixodes persulcatus]